MRQAGSRSRSFGNNHRGPAIAGALSNTRPVQYVSGEQERQGRKGPASLGQVKVQNGTRPRKAPPADAPEPQSPPAPDASGRQAAAKAAADQERKLLNNAKDTLLSVVLSRIDMRAVAEMSREELLDALDPVVQETANSADFTLNAREMKILRQTLLDEIVGFGPLEPLLADPNVNDILVNGANQIYVERAGKLELTQASFRDDDHVLQVANRMCNWAGRRVDISSPMADARLPDGSRVNVIAPPLALRGVSISIRKFGKHKMELDDLVTRGSLSDQMARFLKIATLGRLNIVISGGTGSGKTTMLNALSQFIAPDERIVTIEDAAELQLRQPHVVPLETRPPNLEGAGQVSIRDLLINALRMRPDRIILGEVRGGECFDMLQAFNTGHDGGMCTLHANRPREALSRMENLVALANANFPVSAVRQQITEAIDLIVQIKRMRDGVRRVTDVVEVVGTEGDVITTQPIFTFEYADHPDSTRVDGAFRFGGFQPYCAKRLREAGLGNLIKELLA